MNRVFIDMDGVIVDFAAYMTAHGLTGEEVKRKPGAYLEMQALPLAIESIHSIIGMRFDVFVATKPPTGLSFAYADKAEWIFRNIPELKRKIIITHDKGLLGDEGDILIDDRIHKANCIKFKGRVLQFSSGFGWPEVIYALRGRART